MVELQDQVLPPFDKEMTTPILDTLLAKGRDVACSASPPKAFEQTAGWPGRPVEVGPSDCLPNWSSWASACARRTSWRSMRAWKSGLVAASGSTNTFRPATRTSMRSGTPSRSRTSCSGDPTQVPLAGPANRQGRIAADNIFGRAARYRGTQGTAIVGVFDRTAAMTGASEKALRRANRPYRKVYVHPAHHAGYYPGAEQMTLKLLFDPETGKVLGAQAVGGAGVDKRIDVLAVAIQAGMTVFDLEEMELAYAPQYGSAKDPINMAGFVAGGLLRGDHPQVDVEAVLAAPAAERPFLLDVRTPEEFAAGHIPGAVNIPVDDLAVPPGRIPRDREIAAYCQVGQRGYLATRILLQAGFSAVNIGGGYKTYKLFQPDAH